MNRIPLVIIAILVLGSAGFGLAQLDEIQKLKQSIAAWDQERAALQKRIWDLQKRNNELEHRRFPGSAATAGTSANAGDEARRDVNGGPFRFQGRNDAGRFAAMMSSPEAQKLMALQQKAALDGRYSSLFKQLQLTPADLEKFKNLLVEKQTAVTDVMAAARAGGLTGPDNRDQVRQLVQDAQTEVDNNIRATLGDAAYAQYQSYEATAPQRNVVSQLDQRLSYSSTPLTDAQSQQLVQILATTAPAKTNTGGDAMPAGGGGGTGGLRAGLGGGSSPITADAITQAQSVLSAQQVSALQALQQEQQASALLRQQMQASFQAQAQGTTATTGNQATATRATGPSGP